MSQLFSVFHNDVELQIESYIRIGAVIFRILSIEGTTAKCEAMLWNREDTSALQPYGIKNPDTETTDISIAQILETLREQKKYTAQ